MSVDELKAYLLRKKEDKLASALTRAAQTRLEKVAKVKNGTD